MEPTSIKLSSSEFSEIYEIKNGIPYFKNYIAGEWVFAGAPRDVKSPIDLNVIMRVPDLPDDVIERAIDLVYSKGRWAIRDTPGEKRVLIYHKAADLLEKFKEDFINALIIGNGKTRAAAEGEVNSSIERLRRADLDVRRLYGDYVPGDWSTESLEAEAIIRREPLGVVLAITPFNYPLFDVVNKITYSTVAGNAVIVKPASATPLPALMFARVLELAGFPKSALAVITVPGSKMDKISADKRISVISLTGSTETGEKVIKAAGIKQFVMELGGGDPVFILQDADLKFAAQRVSIGMTSYAGQRCDAIKFILVEEPVYEEFKKYLLEELSKIKVGDPRDSSTTMGPLIDEKTADEVEYAVKDAQSKGAKILFGGKRLGPTYIEPTLIEADSSNIRNLYVYNKEVFAAIAVIMKVKSIDEALDIANGRRYGLDAAIFGKDVDKIRKIIRFVEVGAVYINDYPKHGIGYFPFGGRKDSGIGREGIGYSLEYVTGYKSVVYNYRGKGIWEYS